MITFEDLSDAQKAIIKRICFIQLNSLKRIYEGRQYTDLDIQLILAENEIEEDAFKTKIKEKMDKVKFVGNKPENIGQLSDGDLSSFRHILFHIEKEYQDEYPLAVANLWSRLFLIEEFKTVNYN